jgi:hypothetical protein
MNEYPEELKKQERAAIRSRNEKLNRNKERNPVGVSLSGGGIRSATQSLGAFQALQENNLEEEIDYMSTVSGGGYFGAFWGRCWSEKDTDLSMDNRKVKYLRNSGNYIAPSGDGDFIKGVAQYVINWIGFFLVYFLFASMVSMSFRFIPFVSQVYESGGYYYSLYLIVPLAGILGMLIASILKVSTLKGMTKFMTCSLCVALGGALLFIVDTIGFNMYRKLSFEEIGGLASAGSFVIYLFSLGKDFFSSSSSSMGFIKVITKYASLLVAVVIIMSTPFAFAHMCFWDIIGFENHSFTFENKSSLAYVFMLFILLVGLNLFLGSRKKLINKISMQGIFHNRLVRGFLGAAVPDRLAKGVMYSTDFKDDDVIESQYRPYDNGGPVHIINMTLNETIDGRSDLYQLNRKGCNLAVIPDMSKSVGVRHHCLTEAGKENTYHVPIELAKSYKVWGSEKVESESITVGGYMAISAAAMSTGMGKLTTRFTSLVSGILGVRLGYWWDSGVKRGRVSKVEKLFKNQKLMTMELFAMFKGTSKRSWYLSDGGHFENLGAYELLRRKLKFIISFDHGCDPSYNFESLADLARTVRADFGIELRMLNSSELDDIVDPDIRNLFGEKSDIRRDHGALDGINWNSNGWSRGGESRYTSSAVSQGVGKWAKAYASIVEVKYKDGSVGHMLYVIPTLMGDEPIDVISYYMRNQEFPMQTTNDQFFDEEQWESYRKLMNYIVNKLFSKDGDKTPRKWLKDGKL